MSNGARTAARGGARDDHWPVRAARRGADARRDRTGRARLGQSDGAEPLIGRALAVRRDLLGADHADVATALRRLRRLSGLADDSGDADPLYAEALEMSAWSSER